jgi:hypothetical protein
VVVVVAAIGNSSGNGAIGNNSFGSGSDRQLAIGNGNGKGNGSGGSGGAVNVAIE